MNYEAVWAILPEKNKVNFIGDREDILKFKNYGNTFEHPFSIFIDFESTLKPIQQEESKLEEDEIKTVKLQEHIPNSVGIKYNCIHEKYTEPIKIINNSNPENLLKETIETIERYAINSSKLLEQNKKPSDIKITDEQQKKHNKIKNCNYCSCSFTEENKKVMHHDHITGDYINSICNTCNLQYKDKKFIPIYIHNCKGYDGHFLISALNTYGYKEENMISCIPSTEEKYISFSKKIKVGSYTYKGETKNKYFEIRFIDTLGFLNTSIETLTKNLKKECKTIDELRAVFKNTSMQFSDDEQFKLMTSKGVYPYEYIDNYNKLNETQLPPKEAFYSSLNNSHCSDEDYKQALDIWNKFNCTTILDYHYIYLMANVLLLVDIRENFKKVCSNVYKLHVFYFVILLSAFDGLFLTYLGTN